MTERRSGLTPEQMATIQMRIKEEMKLGIEQIIAMGKYGGTA